MKKLLILLFLIIPCCLFAQFTIKPEFELSTNDEMAKEDFYNLHGTMKFKFMPTDDIELVFKPELDKYEVDIDEISANNNSTIIKFESLRSVNTADLFK